MFGVLLLLFISEIAYSQSVTCPPPTFEVDFTSPMTGKRQHFCQKSSSGSLVKHGIEIVYNSDGKIEKRNTYDEDRLVESLRGAKVEIKSNDIIDFAITSATQIGKKIPCGCTLQASGLIKCWGELCDLETNILTQCLGSHPPQAQTSFIVWKT